MNPELKILNLEIDKARTILYKLTNNKSLTDSNVVFCSQKLDKLLNKYHELLS
ncbi:Spo0E like sporulation regulatory protein [Clostridium acidisoli DSM 12555]|uniref:Spo0E like sporulation regulatory protein n=1 Tax=Clostridium acidisoli DSM 12555 TaxID=1121291 RepID=A0A1W1X819_9CLOT|nr:aspartyl-phosphate phosphatase Spo0E family protein [Clostridium acidisoli]SMC19967.1 Spo0E like sporulation regulatory protein [Clostridium acidisoli DSM 12555]